MELLNYTKFTEDDVSFAGVDSIVYKFSLASKSNTKRNMLFFIESDISLATGGFIG